MDAVLLRSPQCYCPSALPFFFYFFGYCLPVVLRVFTVNALPSPFFAPASRDGVATHVSVGEGSGTLTIPNGNCSPPLLFAAAKWARQEENTYTPRRVVAARPPLAHASVSQRAVGEKSASAQREGARPLRGIVSRLVPPRPPTSAGAKG